MRQFKDNAGEIWTIDLPFGTVKRIKRESEGRFDLLYPEAERVHPVFGKTNLQGLVMVDLEEFFELLYYVVRPACDAKGMTAEQFGERMSGPQLLAARAAFHDEWRDFFQGLQRPDQVLTLEKTREWIEKGMKRLEDRVKQVPIAKMEAMLEARMTAAANEIDKSLQSILNSPSGEPPVL